jgi:hypothetical protein
LADDAGVSLFGPAALLVAISPQVAIYAAAAMVLIDSAKGSASTESTR